MTTQTIQFESVSLSEVGSGALTAFLFSGATLVATIGSITENGILKGRYTGTVADIAAGEYRLVVKFNGYTISEPNEVVTLLLAVGTYVAERYAVLNTATISKIDSIKSTTDKIDTGLVLDGVAWQFTVNMLETAIAEVPKYGDAQRHTQEAYNLTNKTVDVTVTKIE